MTKGYIYDKEFYDQMSDEERKQALSALKDRAENLKSSLENMSVNPHYSEPAEIAEELKQVKERIRYLKKLLEG